MKSLWELGYTIDDSRIANKSNEWFTPARYIEAARAVMGSIDLDPASCAQANWTVKAKMYYKQEENGLEQSWYGNVWLNPPYSSPHGTLGRLGSLQGLVKPFVFKLIDEYTRGNVQQAVLLVTTDTDAKWFLPLWDYPICFADHKVMFHRPGRSNEGQFFGTSFVYLGPNEARFVDVFSAFGTVARRVSPPRVTSLPPSLWEEPLAADDTERNTSHLINTENAKTLHQNRPKSRNEKKDVR